VDAVKTSEYHSGGSVLMDAVKAADYSFLFVLDGVGALEYISGGSLLLDAIRAAEYLSFFVFMNGVGASN
jgi:hypothetical protein